MVEFRYWVYDNNDLMRKFNRLEEATIYAALRGFHIVKKPRPKTTVDLTQFEEALF